MPVVHPSDYKAPRRLFNRHIETIIPAGLRKVKPVKALRRDRVNTPDGDFLDVDWVKDQNDRVVIISHGLEGNSRRPYMIGMINAMTSAKWDVCAWNYRGCSEEMNVAPRLYHSGATDDLATIIEYVIQKGYRKIGLIGFSLGGNLTLKYLGEIETPKFEEVMAATVFSVPVDLASCAREINKPHNFIYSQRFMKSLKLKLRAKAQQFPNTIDLEALPSVKTVYAFDDHYTAPYHGFLNADDYYAKCSAIKFVEGIGIPTLIVNAVNDPFLCKECYQRKPFERSKTVHFEMPDRGGHCGFASYKNGGAYWSELRAVSFLNEHV